MDIGVENVARQAPVPPPVPRPNPLDVTDLTEEQLWEYLVSLGYPVTRRAIKWAVLRREILPVRLGRGNYFSRRDGLDWIESRRQPGNYHAPERA